MGRFSYMPLWTSLKKSRAQPVAQAPPSCRSPGRTRPRRRAAARPRGGRGCRGDPRRRAWCRGRGCRAGARARGPRWPGRGCPRRRCRGRSGRGRRRGRSSGGRWAGSGSSCSTYSGSGAPSGRSTAACAQSWAWRQGEGPGRRNSTEGSRWDSWTVEGTVRRRPKIDVDVCDREDRKSIDVANREVHGWVQCRHQR